MGAAPSLGAVPRTNPKGREMTRNFKILGLALMAIFALGAVAASVASAQTQGKLTSTGPVTLTGTETGEKLNALTAFGGTVECPGSTYTGHLVTTHKQTEENPKKITLEHKNAGIGVDMLPSGSTTATLTPHYKETNAEGKPNCSGPLGTKATVDMNGCDYVVHILLTTGDQTKGPTYGANFDVVCPEKKEITVTFFSGAHTGTPLCVVHVPGQTAAEMVSTVHATDTKNGTIDLVGTVEKITVTQTRNSILCPAGTENDEGVFHLDVSTTGHNAEGKATTISLSDK
jgi:hypothetical protein